MSAISLLQPFSSEEISAIYNKCIYFLINKGVVIKHPYFLTKLNKAGVIVDSVSQRAKFPLEIVKEALNNAPQRFLLAAKNEQNDIHFPHPDGLFYVRNNTGSQNYFDVDLHECRSVTQTDVAEWARVTDALNHIDASCFLTPKDAPTNTADIHALKIAFENSMKPLYVQPQSYQSIEYLCELAQVAAGGINSLKERPLMAMCASSITPFTFKDMDIEILVQAAHYGIPITLVSLPSAGATAPVTIAGTVLVAGIEILALIVMSQLMRPGLPVIGSSNFYTLDMVNGRNLKTSIEAITGTAAVVQFIKEGFGIPAQTHGFGTDSYVPDGQYMVQTSLQAAAVALSGCDLLSAAGRLNALSASSPVQLIIDDAIAGMLKRLKSGVKVSDDTLAFDDILKIEPGGDFLRTDHTLKHCRDALRSDLFASKSLDQWNADGRKDLYARAVEKYHDLRGKESRQHLPKEVIAGMEEVVRKADKHLVN